MMFPGNVRFQMLICGIICLLATSCTPNPTMEADIHGTPGTGSIPVNRNPQVEIEWTYQDAQRFGVEFSITNYPIPQGFQTNCPLTQLEIKNDSGQNLLLYKNPEQISLDEFYALTRNSRWLCKKQSESDGIAEYLFSLTYYYGNETGLQWNEKNTLSVEMGEVIATNSGSMITLPGQGTLYLPLDFETANKNMTWSLPSSMTSNGIMVEIDRVAMNPSFALLDVCIEYQDHHFWRPVAVVLYQGQEVYSTEFIPTFPRYPFNRDTILKSTRRCYSLSIPFNFPLDSLSSFQIGIKQVDVVNTDAGVVTMQECETVKEQLEKTYTGLKIQCYEFEIRGQQQHWFEILSPPPGISTQDAYKLVESAFTQAIPGPWYMEIH